MKCIILPILILSLFGCTSNQNKITPPDGWRVSDKEDVVDDWARYNAPNKIVSDFNNDGKSDTAQILLKKSSPKGFKLIVDMGDLGQFPLEENDEITPQSLAIELLNPSEEVWESACEKGYWDCESGEIRNFKITNPSIQFCLIESACSIFIWSDRNRNFTRIPISD
ncbi:hypothetical protein DCO44_14405 [Acinetobacter sp. AM]|uniref:hypothetical protein n=1 Tax=Acinetobacter sp. AM TaxID=2170730 RepID=UPI000DE687E0|nr:hypothetical protein [Acinetobacter sp. AM]PWB13350.1 hypothetical protein DCO44_14405 [Acinetobacter sp. AM]